MRLFFASIACSAALAAGCGSDVQSPPSTGATTGSGGAATASSGGTGGSGAVQATSASASTGVGGGYHCDAPSVFVDISGDGPLQHLDGSCYPYARIVLSNAPPPSELLRVTGCSTDHIFSVSGTTVWPGSTGNADVQYIRYMNGGSEYDNSDSGTLTITSLGPVGSMVEGSFSAIVKPTDPSGPGPAEIALSGNFRVCRVPEEI